MAWIGAAIAIAATLAKAKQDQQVAKKQDRQMAAAMRQQEQAEQQARAKIQSNLQNFAPDKAQQTQTAEQGDYLAQVQKAMGGGGPYKADGALSQSVQLQNQRAKESEGANSGLAKLFGTIGAAGTQRQNEAIGTAQTGSALSTMAGSANRQFAAKKQLAASIHANPWLRMFLDAAQSYGTASAAGGMGGASALGTTQGAGPAGGAAFGGSVGYGASPGMGSLYGF